MAELRHTFAGGKMNKDLDERIVPQGEYRDALNIEIRTSGDSNIGALQNLYGNKGRIPQSELVSPTVNWIGDLSCHVGSIASERDNKAYFFIASAPYEQPGDRFGYGYEDITSVKLYKDMILEYNNKTRIVSPIAIDVWKLEGPIASLGTITDSNGSVNGHASNPYHYIDITTNGKEIIRNIRASMGIDFFDANGYNPITAYRPDLVVDNGLGKTKVRHVENLDNGSLRIHFNKPVKGVFTSVIGFQFSALYDNKNLTDNTGRALNFSQYNYIDIDGDGKNRERVKNPITGINIIPGNEGNDLLFWTNSIGEPRKINIKRSKAGCDGFSVHTSLMITNPSTGSLTSIASVDNDTEDGFIKDHITVIKRAPRTSPKLEMSEYESGVYQGQQSNLVAWNNTLPNIYGLEQSQNLFTTNFSPFGIVMEPGDHVNVVTGSGFEYYVGDRFEIYNDSSSIVVKILNHETFPQVGEGYEVEIEIISPDIPEDLTQWSVRTYKPDEKEPYFQLKFGRFSFRYKYQDGEYSPFAPWSEIAFLPGKFDYLPKKGYNLGMVNNLRLLRVTDFIVDDALRPDDVVEVDILYKDTVSPNVYIVKTIKRGKNHEWNEVGEGSFTGVLNITSEMIHRTLESSQILRAWDNVPRKARAQEVTGNRIVYGNYLQNYNVDSDVSVKQSFITSPHPGGAMEEDGGRLGYKYKQRKEINYNRGSKAATSTDSNYDSEYYLKPIKSLKSIRRYRIGVVFGDKYGRETPVIGMGGYQERNPTLGTAQETYPDSVDVSKTYAPNINQLTAQLVWNQKPDHWIEYYKFYVKETSNEYYNMVQDRWYNAEDGNLWLSFQSSDRNKVDDDTYLILKNEHGNQKPVLEKARYKILSIKNEAPDFIKTTHKILGSAPFEANSDMQDSMVVSFSSDAFYQNFMGDGSFDQDGGGSTIKFKGIGYGRLRAIEGGVARFSEWQKIARINQATRTITLVDPFGPSAAFAESLNLTSYSDIDEYEFEMKDAVVENRPEFDGKFFVKIHKDGILANKVIEETDDSLTYATVGMLNFRYVASQKYNNWAGSGNTYRGDFTSVSAPVPGSADDQGGNDFTGDSWGHGNGLNSGNVDEMAHCDYRDETKNFWNWFENNSGAAVYLDNARGASGGGNADDVGANHPGILYDSEHEYGSDGANAIQWAVVGSNGFSAGGQLDFYNKMTQQGKLFRFAADPTNTIYVISGSTALKTGHNYHKNCSSLPDCAGGLECRRMFRTYFHKKGSPQVGMSWGEWDPRSSLPHDGTRQATIEFVEMHFDKSESVEITSGNAIWETEPKEDVGMDLYYEATDAIPMYLNGENIQSYIPLNSTVTVKRNGQLFISGLTVKSAIRDVVCLGNPDKPSDYAFGIQPGDTLHFLHADGTVTQANVLAHWKKFENNFYASDYQPATWNDSMFNRVETGAYRLEYNTYEQPITLSWFNCYSFGNGIESDRIRDDFNAPTIDNGCKVSTTLEDFGEETRASGLIWSGIYNSTSGVNNLNEFNMAGPITKDLNPSYGSIQALKTRDTNVVAFCEDKVFKILANKDALYNADGSSNVTASNAVLGDAKAFVGDYGISSNPESLAVDSYRMYFTDKQRNKVLRLSQDGLTPISDVGFISYFRDNLGTTKHLIGSYDEIKGEYNLTLAKTLSSNETDTTLSWSEQTKGWVSFKSFIPQTGLSINDEYLTGKITADENKTIWSHHNEDKNTDGSLEVDVNSFYGDASVSSTVDVLFNKSPEVVKGFTTMSYEGSQARVNGWENEDILDANGNTVSAYNNSFKDLQSKDGWYVESFVTDLQQASVPEFISKENKWFEYIKGDETTLSNLDTKEFSVQGISLVDITNNPPVTTFTLTIDEVDEV